jgi:hypothetical protein
MAKTKTTWDWIGGYPVFIYTTFVDHFKFLVRVDLGEKGNQNDQSKGETILEYTQAGLAAKDDVVDEAMRKAEILLYNKGLITVDEAMEDVLAREGLL